MQETNKKVNLKVEKCHKVFIKTIDNSHNIAYNEYIKVKVIPYRFKLETIESLGEPIPI